MVIYMGALVSLGIQLNAIGFSELTDPEVMMLTEVSEGEGRSARVGTLFFPWRDSNLFHCGNTCKLK